MLVRGRRVDLIATVFALTLRTKWGGGIRLFQNSKCRFLESFPEAAISRFARTLGTLLGSGVPVLQGLTIVRETTGNVVVGNVVSLIHANVKEGERLTTPIGASTVFPPMVAGMVDVGEQTGALPDLLMKIADNYDDQVDNAVNSMTSLLEPIMIMILGVIVGGLVIAMFLPIIGVAGGLPTKMGTGRICSEVTRLAQPRTASNTPSPESSR